MFGTESDDETFDGNWTEIGLESIEETLETQSVEDNSTEAAELNGTNAGEELKERNLTEEQQAILFRIKEVLKRRTREALPSLKTCNKTMVQTETSKVGSVHYNFQHHRLQFNLFYTVVLVVSERLGKIRKGKGKTKSEKKEPYWKRSIENNIKK